jgi:hypothetical protein
VPYVVKEGSREDECLLLICELDTEREHSSN